MKYEIFGAKDHLGNDIEGKWEIIDTSIGERYGDKFYDTPEKAVLDLSLKELEKILKEHVLHYAEENDLLTPSVCRLVLAKAILTKLPELGFIRLENVEMDGSKIYRILTRSGLDGDETLEELARNIVDEKPIKIKEKR